jgi:phage shock protein E
MIAFFKRLLGLDQAPLNSISPSEAQAKVKQGAIILDVRSPLERQALSIPGSKTIPLDELATKLETLPKGKEIICQCASGMRSARAARFLAAQGFAVHNLSGGIQAWQQASLPVKKGSA